VHDRTGTPVTERGKYVAIWKKQPDGRWKAAVDTFNSDLPASR
jgi:ketosteroid isomerase-like protein